MIQIVTLQLEPQLPKNHPISISTQIKANVMLPRLATLRPSRNSVPVLESFQLHPSFLLPLYREESATSSITRFPKISIYVTFTLLLLRGEGGSDLSRIEVRLGELALQRGIDLANSGGRGL